MQMVAADWLKSDKREDDLAGRPGSIVQVDNYLLIISPYFQFRSPLSHVILIALIAFAR